MNGTQIISRFEKMGAKVNLIATSRSRLPVLNIHSAGNGRSSKDEVFDLTIPDGFSAEVLDCKPSERHLLLMLKGDGDYKAKFLCGHDERHWFVAGVPEAAGASTVVQAKRALMPKDVADETVRKGLKSSKALRRRNKAFIRQGEWFFTPDPSFAPSEDIVIKNEPLTRQAGGKPHQMEFACRSGGETVYVLGKRMVSEGVYKTLSASEKSLDWRAMRRGASVYAKGRITHPDHATVILSGWHKVSINMEGSSRGATSVAFLD